MAKTPNSLDSVRLTLTTTPQVKEYLEQLVSAGLHGKNAAEAAERVLVDALAKLVDGEKLKRVAASVMHSTVQEGKGRVERRRAI